MTTVTAPGVRPADRARVGGVEFGFCVSHAPQIFTQPKEEDPAELARMHEGYRTVARRAREKGVDVLIIVALDHLHNHFLNLVPQFTLFTGTPVVAQFNQRRIELNGSPDMANSLMDGLLDRGFDPAFSQNEVLDHSFLVPLNFMVEEGIDVPVLPIVVNAYVPPQPGIRRCHDLGRAIASWAEASGVRAGIVATGGMSHYPGTQRFSAPDVQADQRVLGWLESGDVEKLVSMSAAELDGIGMVELRTWAIALGARGEHVRVQRRSYWDSGHCGYAVIEF
jgi:aromatic ring-opening dioxygenase catalytic subunit (LigB family)